jgi:hypothetical protein
MEIKEENDLSTCRVCDKIKPRRFVGKFDDRNKKYVDADGKLWSGRICPQCHKDRAKNNMRRLRKFGKKYGDLENGTP